MPHSSQPPPGQPSPETSGREPKAVVDSAFPRVDRGHIVPATYQRNFAADGRVLLHNLSGDTPELRNVKTAFTRGPFYRRSRPDGTLIDDTESDLAKIEDQAGKVFSQIRKTNDVDPASKLVLATFFGLQLVRSPTFFDVRETIVTHTLEKAAQGKPPAPIVGDSDEETVLQIVAEFGVDAVRERVADHFLGSTERALSMLGLASKAAAVLVNMHWSVLRFDDPVLVYSDHPVVVWPASVPLAEGFRGQQFPPVDAIEVRIPLTSRLFLLLTWLDEASFQFFEVQRPLAGELNQLTIGQAEREWAQTPETRPPIARRGHEPLGPQILSGYNVNRLNESVRRQHVQRFLQRHRRDRIIDKVEIINLAAPQTASSTRPVLQRRAKPR